MFEVKLPERTMGQGGEHMAPMTLMTMKSEDQTGGDVHFHVSQ